MIEAIINSFVEKYDAIMNTLREKKNTNLKYFISMDLEENAIQFIGEEDGNFSNQDYILFYLLLIISIVFEE